MSNAEMMLHTRYAETGRNDYDHVGDYDARPKAVSIRCNGVVFVFKPRKEVK